MERGEKKGKLDDPPRARSVHAAISKRPCPFDPTGPLHSLAPLPAAAAAAAVRLCASVLLLLAHQLLLLLLAVLLGSNYHHTPAAIAASLVGSVLPVPVCVHRVGIVSRTKSVHRPIAPRLIHSSMHSFIHERRRVLDR